MKPPPLAALALVVAVSACTPDAPADPEDVETCDGLVDVGTELVEDYLEAVEGLPIDVLTGAAAAPVDLDALQVRGADLDARAAALSCDLVALNDGIVAATQELTSDDPAGRLYLEVVRAGLAPGAAVEPVPPPDGDGGAVPSGESP